LFTLLLYRNSQGGGGPKMSVHLLFQGANLFYDRCVVPYLIIMVSDVVFFIFSCVRQLTSLYVSLKHMRMPPFCLQIFFEETSPRYFGQWVDTVTSILDSLGENLFSSCYGYHRKCYQKYTHKRLLQKLHDETIEPEASTSTASTDTEIAAQAPSKRTCRGGKRIN
jgi:hypothetical protein